MYGAAMIVDSLIESTNRSKVAPQGEVMDSMARLSFYYRPGAPDRLTLQLMNTIDQI